MRVINLGHFQEQKLKIFKMAGRTVLVVKLYCLPFYLHKFCECETFQSLLHWRNSLIYAQFLTSTLLITIFALNLIQVIMPSRQFVTVVL